MSQDINQKNESRPDELTKDLTEQSTKDFEETQEILDFDNPAPEYNDKPVGDWVDPEYTTADPWHENLFEIQPDDVINFGEWDE